MFILIALIEFAKCLLKPSVALFVGQFLSCIRLLKPITKMIIIEVKMT